MRCEVVAVGTELLLGHVVDTTSAWLGQRLATAGIDCHFHTTVGDNRARITDALRAALARSEAVVVSGGLGPTPDDITREAIADLMGVPLERDVAVLERIRAIFESRRRPMPASNERQADVPRGATVIPQSIGTAPGLMCDVGERVLYAVPGVPAEMEEMVERAVLPDLRARAGAAATIVARTVRTWGMAESSVAEALAPRLDALDATDGSVTIGFVASGTRGVEVRLVAKAATAAAANQLLDAEEGHVRALLGPAVFGVDDETLESVVGSLLRRRRLSLGLAESVTGGLLASRLVSVPGASHWLRGAVVAYERQVKLDVLGLPGGPVVSEEGAAAMAEGARRVLRADVGLGLTGVAGPDREEEVVPGTVFVGLSLPAGAEVAQLHVPGDRERVRQFAATSALDLLRRRLLDAASGEASARPSEGTGEW